MHAGKKALTFVVVYSAASLTIWGSCVVVHEARRPGSMPFSTALTIATTSIAEGLIMGAAVWWLLNRPGRRVKLCARVGACVIASLHLLVTVSQSYSLWLANSVITVLAIENAAHSQYVASRYVYAALLAPAGVGAVVIWRIGRRLNCDRATSSGGATVLSVACFSLILLIALRASDNPSETSMSLHRAQSPVASLISTSWEYVNRGANISVDDLRLTGDSCGFGYNPSARFPFVRQATETIGHAFPGAMHGSPNIIVIHLEGTSARLLEPYGAEYPSLTPNIRRLAEKSMVVDNYFNHTAATFRGLQGQYTSGYPFYGGTGEGGWLEEDNADHYTSKSLLPLTDMLERRRGYETYFMSPHSEQSPFHRMITGLGFDEVYSYERARRELGISDRLSEETAALSDPDLFTALERFLRNREQDDQPWLLGTYPVGTHAFVDVEVGGSVYGKGLNHTLNTLHNFDLALGEFLDFFFASEYFANTMLVLTSDHAHYPEPSYVEAIDDTSYKPYFVDRIPLMIYSPVHALPERFDAGGRTSLDFAPTILHLLGVSMVQNAFMGVSIFDRSEYSKPIEIAAWGDERFAIHDGMVYSEDEVPNSLTDKFVACSNVISLYHAHDVNDTIAP